MKILSVTVFIVIFFSGVVYSQNSLSKDKDYQNFKRNYDKAIKYYGDLKNNIGRNAEASAKRYSKYARKFLDKIITKYDGINFTNEQNNLSEIESYFQKKENKKNSAKSDFEYVQLWIFRLKPNSLNSSNSIKNLKNFNKNKLNKSYQSVKNSKEFKRRFLPQDIKSFEMALNDFENYLIKINVFDKEKGMIGRFLDDSKRIQDIDYFVKTVSIAKDITNALLIISPNSPSLLAKKNKISSLIANADLEVKRNKPKLVKKYRDKLPKAYVRNKKLERQFIDAIRYQKYPGVTITSAIVTSSNWILQKSVDGRSLYRWREGVVTAKTKGGDCWFQFYNFKQPYTGTGFGKVIRNSSGERFYINCSQI